jgi:hypothetical protein
VEVQSGNGKNGASDVRNRFPLEAFDVSHAPESQTIDMDLYCEPALDKGDSSLRLYAALLPPRLAVFCGDGNNLRKIANKAITKTKTLRMAISIKPPRPFI